MREEFNRGIYDSLDEFISQYSKSSDAEELFRGMDFTYKGEDYRICRELGDVFYVYKYIGTGYDCDLDILATCNSLEELLDCTAIKNVPFREIVMDEVNTVIYGQDY